MSKPHLHCQVRVEPYDDASDPANHQHAYTYTITIENRGDVAAQVVARHWTITDSQGQVQEVRGLAVVGHQPLLQPGERFEYSSWAQIATPQGSMQGRYLCVTDQAEVFWAEVPEFLLAQASSLH
ncbi:Co2+/Mg2+ efflux protein ApaG [Roseateles sp. BYS180W]|uniref:Co2+/Mg2+ efflux protein ApaG n=1 Tax=Roseateles rivi TaxID=3299028 RepID=A0ABW7FWR6_9BURK